MLSKNSKITAILEKILWIYLFVNPFIDFATGFYICEFVGATELDIQASAFGSTPGLYVRMFMLVLFTLYLLIKRDKPAIFTVLGMGLAWVASIAILLLRGTQLILGVDIKYFVKYCYNIIMLFAYVSVFVTCCDDRAKLMQRIRTLICYTCLVYSVAIIIPYCLQVGYFTYADRLGYRGSRGYFTSANDVTAVFVILLPLSLSMLLGMDKKLSFGRKLLYVLTPSLSFVTMCLIGSKTAFLAAGFAVLVMLIAAIFAKDGTRGIRITRLLIMLFTVLMVFLILAIFVGKDKIIHDIYDSLIAPFLFAANEDVETAVLSGRDNKLREQFAMYISGGLPTILFGIGRSTVELIVEMDICEVVIYYGLVGAVAMLWIYVLLAVDFFKGFSKKRGLTSLSLFIGIGLAAGYLIISGHVLFTVTSGQYFILAIILSRLYFSEGPEDIAISPRLLRRKA